MHGDVLLTGRPAPALVSTAPAISIITVVKNNREGLLRTLASVQAQSFRDFEHIVIDGGSTDGTQAVLEAHAAHIARWISAADGGIADAFNKGLRLARGSFINFLNGGDRLADSSALGRAAEHFHEASIITGYITRGGTVEPPAPVRSDEPLPRRAWLSHQASFVHRRVFDACGEFDTRFKISMDYEHWLRVLPRFPHVFIEEVFVDFEGDGVSCQDAQLLAAEREAAHRMHLPHAELENLRVAVRNKVHHALNELGLFAAYRRWWLRRRRQT